VNALIRLPFFVFDVSHVNLKYFLILRGVNTYTPSFCMCKLALAWYQKGKEKITVLLADATIDRFTCNLSESAG
jgi:hypothetical protein